MDVIGMSVLRMTEAELAARNKRVLRPCTHVQATTPLPKARKARGGAKSREIGVSGSEGEIALAAQLADVPGWEREYEFCPPRKFRFDFAFIERRLAVEIEGGIWTKGAHTRGKHFLSDAEKYNLAAMMGWAVLRFDTDQAKNGFAYRTIMEFLKL